MNFVAEPHESIRHDKRKTMQRFTGDYCGDCDACGEYVEFALGVQTGREPVAMHFGPRGPEPILLRDVNLVTMMDDELDVKFGFDCPLCGGASKGRATCKSVHHQ